MAQNKQKKKRESEPRTRDLQSPFGDFSKTKNLWQVTHNPEDEEKDGEKRETGKGRFISFFLAAHFKNFADRFMPSYIW